MKTNIEVRNNLTGHTMYASINKDEVRKFTSFYNRIRKNGVKKYTIIIKSKQHENTN